MKFDLHSDAIAVFTAQSQAIADRVCVKEQAPQSMKTGFKVDVFVAHALTANDLRGPIEVFSHDENRNRVSRFKTEGDKLGLFKKLPHSAMP